MRCLTHVAHHYVLHAPMPLLTLSYFSPHPPTLEGQMLCLSQQITTNTGSSISGTDVHPNPAIIPLIVKSQNSAAAFMTSTTYPSKSIQSCMHQNIYQQVYLSGISFFSNKNLKSGQLFPIFTSINAESIQEPSSQSRKEATWFWFHRTLPPLHWIVSPHCSKQTKEVQEFKLHSQSFIC